jgi:CHAT domain-containing protein
LIATLSWLWERLIEPVDRHLQEKIKLTSGAPVVLLPPGLLGLLPLHAAGPGSDGRHFCDHWTVSYAPSVQTLLICRQRLEQRRGAPLKLLAVIDPLGDLPGAAQEGFMLQQWFACADQLILRREQARLAPVLESLPAATHFHASAHGQHDPLEPTESRLVLADEPLRLELLRNTRLDASRLVFLSACESRLAGVRQLPEEFIGLPEGFVQVGAACVVGSLWPIRDDAAYLLASAFYERHLDEHGHERLPPLVALHGAQNWLRNLTFRDLKQLFRVCRRPDGEVVLLQPVKSSAQTKSDPGDAIELLLGPDDEFPYAAPEFWAAFTGTGL